MRRRLTHTPYFIALLLILTLTLSFIYVPIVASQNSSEIIFKLRELQGDVSPALLPNEAFENTHAARGQRKALINKINATIHQIKAGAYKGAINKLENDMKNTIEAWITEAYEQSLIDKVDEIIKLIKGELPPPDFSMEASPTSLTIALGESESSTITITSSNGFSELVDLTVSGVPSGVTTILDPTQVTPPADGSKTSTLTVQVEDSATPGTYTLTVTGTSGSLLHGVDIELEITTVPPSPDFSIAVHPSSLSIQQGTSRTANIIIASLNGFSDPVTLTVSPAIDGVTYSLDPSEVTPPADDTITSKITIAIAETATPNNYTLTLTGTSGALQHSASLSLEITKAPPPPDVNPPTVRIDEPANGSHLAGLVNIVVFMYDKNFKRAELTINNTRIASWTPENVSTGEHSITWDTTLPEYPDGLYNITLSAEDEAGNDSEETRIVTVDNTKPTATISAPAEETYLRGSVLIRVTGEDKNFYKMNLKIDNVSVKNWTTGGSQIYEWNTEVDGIDGAHAITLTVYDKAGNSDESSVTVIVDNTLPTIRIDEPVEGSYLAGIADIKVFIQEDNLDKVELTINDTDVGSWTLSGEHVFNWNTITYAEGSYLIKLKALDKAGNIGEKTIKVTVDNTSPIIEAPTWTPKEPSTDEQVNVTVKVIDPQLGSGIQNVTLWYRNTTMDDSQPILMSLNDTSGNWTATIPAQSTETTIEFYIEAFDIAGNKARKPLLSDETYEYKVIAPAGIPLAWIVAIILLILAATATAIYFWRKRRREKQGISSRA